MAIDGKLHSRNSRSSSFARLTDLTKMQTCNRVSRVHQGKDWAGTSTHLVEFEVVQQVIQLSVLGVLLELDIVLLQTMQGELGLVVNKDFQRLRKVSAARPPCIVPTFCINFRQVTRTSLPRVALNIMTCLWAGVARKIS